MIELISVDIKEFKDVVYPEYKKLFPKFERKSYRNIKKAFNNNITKILKIVKENTFIGFMIFNTLKENKYLQLDYFAILPKYQGLGYGTEALNLLKLQSQEYNGIFIEVEKIGLGKNEKENFLRSKRINFYERIGFCKLTFDLELYHVIYTPYILQLSDIKENEEKILNDIFDIYMAIFKKRGVEKYCKVIKE